MTQIDCGSGFYKAQSLRLNVGLIIVCFIFLGPGTYVSAPFKSPKGDIWLVEQLLQAYRSSSEGGSLEVSCTGNV